MIFQKPEKAALQNESDVEQKLLYPLLVAESPGGLGYSPIDIYTKSNLRKFSIGKGSEQKAYFPDYVLARGGIPFAVIEAKSPSSGVDEAYREARLYASELNSLYRSGISPVKYIIASDGMSLVAGYADQSLYKYSISFDEIDVYNESFSRFCDEFSQNSTNAHLKLITYQIRPRRYWKPRKQVGGISIQREEVGMNSFGATLSSDFAHIFNPQSNRDRSFIAKNAYIPSKRRERYIDPIDRVIRAAKSPSEAYSKTIENSADPEELIRKLRGGKSLEHKVLLIVGSAGAGKSTFVDHLQVVALPRDVRENTLWIRLNMNPAPISREEIYGWLRDEIIEACKQHHPGVDFDDLDIIKKVYAADVSQFRKGIGRLLEGNKEMYNLKLAEHLESKMSDKHVSAINYISFCAYTRNKLPIIVLDNCDKRLRDEQLLMFEAAQWLQREFKCLVVLPLREETYDNHQNEPPLDTALKDLVFRIEPPLFQKILQSRIQLAMSSIKNKGSKTLRYSLPNGMQVDYPASDQGHYLSSILRSVFEHDAHVRRLIVGLAGRNMRRAMEIFIDFCTSGHISEDHILKMIQSEGKYVLPLSLVMTVLLRANLRYYDSDRAYLKNIYAASELDERPAFFSRLLILKRLDELANYFGAKRLKGYVRIGDIKAEMNKFGVTSEVLDREIESLAKGFCILSEDFRTEGLSDNDLIKIAPAGRVHLQIHNDAYYLATVAEDTWFPEEAISNSIAERMRNSGDQFNPKTVLRNAIEMVRHMNRIFLTDRELYDSVFSDNRMSELVDIEGAKRSVNRMDAQITGSWFSAPDKFMVGEIYAGRISGIKGYGVFVELDENIYGLVHSSGMNGASISNFKVGQKVMVIVDSLDHIDQRMNLIFHDYCP